MHILLTGFEPFGGSTLNPSELVARQLDGKRIAGLQVVTAILPVDRQRGPDSLLAAVKEVQPSAVICLGEASRRPQVSIERVAINLLDYRIADNAGNQVIDQPIAVGGPAAYFSTLPVRAIYEAVQAAGVPVELSLSAGAFLCNQVLYCLLHHFALTGQDIPAGFIHLPSLPQQAARSSPPMPSMSLETSLCAVQTAIETTAANLR